MWQVHGEVQPKTRGQGGALHMQTRHGRTVVQKIYRRATLPLQPFFKFPNYPLMRPSRASANHHKEPCFRSCWPMGGLPHGPVTTAGGFYGYPWPHS